MVTVLQLNRLELKEMINQEIVENPVLEESVEDGEEITPEELQPLLEAERATAPADQSVLDAADIKLNGESPESGSAGEAFGESGIEGSGIDGPGVDGNMDTQAEAADAATTDPFDEIDFGSFFDDYLDPGYRSPASESVEKPSFETFLSQPQTLPDYLRSQLSVTLIDDDTRDAAESIIGNLDENGYLTASLDEMASQGGHSPELIEAGLKAVQSLVEPLQMVMENGAKRALIPLENKRNFLEVSGEIMEKVDPIFYSDPQTAAMKALALK